MRLGNVQNTSGVNPFRCCAIAEILLRSSRLPEISKLKKTDTATLSKLYSVFNESINVFCYVTIRHCNVTSNLEKQEAFFYHYHHGDKLYEVVRSWSLRFPLYLAYNVFLLCDNLTLTIDNRRWKPIGIFRSSWWIIVTSCNILKLMVQSVSCLQCTLPRFPSVTIRPWPLTYDLGIFLSSWWSFVLSCTFCNLQFTLYHVYNVFL